MSTDELERQLQRQTLRSVPAAWKEEILQAAQAAVRCRARTVPARSTSAWREWLWPAPPAWAGLAAVWLLIVVLHFSDSVSDPSPASHGDFRPSPEVLSVLAEQRRWLLELTDGAPQPAAPEIPPVLKPRSARRIAIVY